jgi:alanine dehydrogenase
VRIISASDLEEALDYPSLVERLRGLLRAKAASPMRQHYELPDAGEGPATLLVMPGWLDRRFIGVKVVSVVPENASRGLATVMGSYLMLDGRSGRPIALMDGPVLTRRRTAATSALAAKYLARPDSERLLMVGTGAMAPYLIEAHASVRPIASVLVWGRNEAKAKTLARRMNRSDLRVEATSDLEGAVRGADIVTCATLSQVPLVHGCWLTAGTHLDLVGGFTPAMRETDDDAVRRGRLFVDDRDSAMSEAGDVVQPIEDGVITADDVAGDLGDLVRGQRDGRRFYDQVTIFKAVGTAIADLAAGYQALERT